MSNRPLARLALATAAALLATTAAAETLRIQTSFNAGDYAFKYMTETWAPKLTEMTGGEIELELLPTKAVVPHKETPDAVAIGVLDGDLTATEYFSGRGADFAILGNLIAGYDTPEQGQGFCKDGGGEEALQAAFDRILAGKIHVIGCGPYNREALVAAKEIDGVAALKGVKIRAPEGLASEVFRRAGATPVNIPFSEVYTSLEKGIVDAADASAYVNNDATGMQEIAKFPIYPGIHSQAQMQFTLNQAKWDSLSEETQKAMHQWFYDAYADMAKAVRAKDEELVARDKAGGVITVVDWSQADRDTFREIAKSAWEDYAAKSDEARAALDAHLAYMKASGLLQ